MWERSLATKVGRGLALCLLLVSVYVAGVMMARSASSPDSKIEVGHTVNGDPLAGLELDASQYGTESEEERDAIGDCYESRVGVRVPEELATPSFDELYAWRECAVELGIESKVMMIEPPSERERRAQAEAANEEIREQRACLKGLGWKIVRIPESNDGIINFRVDAEHDSETKERLATDSASCGITTGQEHDH